MNLQAVLDSLDQGTIVEFPAGEISSAVTIPAGLILKGNNAGIEPNNDNRKAETIFSAPATFTGNVRVNGFKFTARPVFDDVTGIEVQNTIFEGIDVSSASGNLNKAVIGTSDWYDSIKFDFQNNLFADNTGVYNLFEICGSYADGSIISNNEFTADCCGHNQINIYAADDNANITISNNKFAKSANAIRVGTKGAVQNVNILINGNEYDDTDTDPDWAGILLIQPYATQTDDMSGVTINLNNTINNTAEPQLWYYYAGAGDAQLTNAQKPDLYVDGVPQVYPIIV